MLELRNIIKDYVSGNNVTHALKGISVNFRRNEFVSILGPSGCGKTTTLNIIGGLDRYTKGNLLINGKSTKQYKDRDWDTYRNHSIGFVFQTYNLITHQNILKNVELALTISGVSREERKQRAYQVLKIVGLEGMEKKKPNQLSGGQCQRVAIARALINNPEILLADEPTGALDSETSVQIMDLLKEVASDRLVIMVTHNPDLANKYSTRIITMSDGLLTSDSNPFDGKEEKTPKKPENSQENDVNSDLQEVKKFTKGKKKKSSMSLLTSIGLSTSNLLSKMKRTILVMIAGSIGIIGVSAVLGVSRGVKDYIKDLQNDMLSSYPISIAEESVDYTALITGLNNQNNREKFKFNPEDPKVGVDSMISYLMSAYSDLTNVKTNTIDEKMLSFIDGMPKDNVGSIKYNYAIDPTNNLFGKWRDQKSDTNDFISFNGLTQRYIAELMTVDGFTEYANFVDLFTSFMNELPADNDYVLNQYDVIAGEYSTNEDDLVLVVDKDTTLTDVVLAQIGVFDHDSFLNIATCALGERNLKEDPEFEKKTQAEKDEAIAKVRAENPYNRDFGYDELVGREFYYFPQNSLYKENVVINNEKKSVSLNFVILDSGNIKAFVNLSLQTLAGLNVLMGSWVIKNGANYETTTVACLNADRFNDPEYKILTKPDLAGTWLGFNVQDLMAYSSNMFELLNHISFGFSVDANGEAGTYSDNVSFVPYTMSFNFADEENITIDTQILDDPVKGYAYDATATSDMINNPSTYGGMKLKISSILRLKDSKNFGCLSRGLYFPKTFGAKYIDESKNGKVTNDLKAHISNSLTHNTQYSNAYVRYSYYDHKLKTMRDDGYASSLNGDLSTSFSDLFSGLTGVNYFNTNATYLRSLCGYKALAKNNDEGEFVSAEFKFLPREISIYPKSFDGKDSITNYLDRWNSDEILTLDGVEYTKAQRDDMTYTDTISLIVAVIDTFINAITIALIVFTSLSLVVSCFMIAVITYISVVERIKEIGVIRSLGGRKGDVASLFIVETMMTGLFSGVFGIVMTYILQIIVNAILLAKFGLAIMNLTIWTAFMMIGISVALSVLSGLVPSQSAAHKDPVVALRSNE